MTTSPTRTAALALYTPPFRYEHGYIFDANGHMVADDCGEQPGVATRVRGWGRIGYMKDAESLQDEVGALIAEILTAHWGRAPAAPVPQGWKMVPVEPTKEMLQRACSDHGYPGGSRWVYRDGYRSMLAAAPQPPELATSEHSAPMCGAAPKVDPIAWYVTGCSTMLDEHDAKAEAKRCGGCAQAVPLYTEQQVRELLAAHGIGDPS